MLRNHFRRFQFSLANTFWFTIGTLMQQGCDVAPISLSTRLRPWTDVKKLILGQKFSRQLHNSILRPDDEDS
jgi:hypothetical protein